MRCVTLPELSPFTEALKRPRSQTQAGGLMAIVCIPGLLVGYSLYWFSDWYRGLQGLKTSTDLMPVEWKHGIALDGSDKHNQTLTCIARSGCWYTVLFNPREGLPDGCPPRSDKEQQRRATLALTRDLGLTADAGNLEEPRTIDKKCMYARHAAAPSPYTRLPQSSRPIDCRPLERLQHACLHFSPDPIDALSLVWRAEDGDVAASFGVALTTTTVILDSEGCAPTQRTLFSSCDRQRAGFRGKLRTWPTLELVLSWPARRPTRACVHRASVQCRRRSGSTMARSRCRSSNAHFTR